MWKLNKFRILMVVVSVAFAVAGTNAKANVVYTYQGDYFNIFYGSYSGADSVSGSITLSSALGDNLFYTDVTPISFTFSDGIQTVTSSETPWNVDGFEFSTDASGNITAWSIIVYGSAYSTYIETSSTPGGDAGQTNLANHGVVYYSPGNWESASVSSTPLPSTWTMLIAGFVGLGFFAYCGTKKNSAALAAA